MIKRLQITLLALFVSVWAMASETSVKNADGVEIWYDFDSSAKTASVTYRGESQYSYYGEYIGNVVIPLKVKYEGEEYSVTSIESFAFQVCSSLTSVTIPGSVKTIGEGAFDGCSSLTSIDMALDNNSYTSIDGVLFSKDKTILIKYPEGKKNVTSYAIPESVTEIGSFAFLSCSSLTSITIPKGVTEIGDWAFSYCSSLTSITIPESVTSIGENAFSDCDALTSITIPENVTSIGENAFLGCRSLTSITLPEGVTEIGDDAFSGCIKLYEVYNKSNLAITAGSSENGEIASYAKNVYTDDSGESKLHTAGDYIFYVDEDNIELLAYIGDEIAITLPSDYEGKDYIIANYGFYGCNSLTSITIPKSVTEIGEWAFSECRSLTSITIPESVTSIVDYTFYGCYKLYEVYNKSNLAITAGSWGNGFVAYYAKNVYTDDSGESKLHTVGDYIFYVDEDNIELLAYIRDETAITLPSDYEGKNYKIGDYAFDGCSSLTSITIPEGVTSIGKMAFSDCSSLTSITIPESVTSIGENAFSDCSSLTSITIPESVTSIGENAFSYCSSLTSITSMNITPPSIGNSYTFDEVDKSIPVYVPKQSVEAYKSAEYWKDFTNIQGIDDVTPISDVVADSVSIRLIGNSLIVEGAESYAVYALGGQCLGKVESLERGLYIVVADGVSKRIVVK